MKKSAAAVFAALTAALVFCSCQSGEQPSGQNDNPPEETERIEITEPAAVENNAPEPLPEDDIRKDTPPREDCIYDDVVFSYTKTVGKGEWDWFNAIVDPWDNDGGTTYFMQMYEWLQADGARLNVYLNNASAEIFADLSAATFDAGIQNTEDGNYEFAMIRSDDVKFTERYVLYTVDAQKLLDIIDDYAIKPECAQLVVQFSGFTPEADGENREITVEVVIPRTADTVPEEIEYSDPEFTFTRENVTKGDYDWFNAIFSRWDGDGYMEPFTEAIAKEGSRVFISSPELTPDRFTGGAPEGLTIGYQGTEDYSVITYVGADDIVTDENGLRCSVSGQRLYESMVSAGLDPKTSQIYVSIGGFNEEGDSKSCDITVEVRQPLTAVIGDNPPAAVDEEAPGETQISLDASNFGIIPIQNAVCVNGTVTVSNENIIAFNLPKTVSLREAVTFHIKGSSDGGFRVWLLGKNDTDDPELGQGTFSNQWISSEEGFNPPGEFDFRIRLVAEDFDRLGLETADRIAFKAPSWDSQLENFKLTYLAVIY